MTRLGTWTFLSLLAAAGGASAQSSQVQMPAGTSVTFFGVIDIYGAFGDGSQASRSQLSSGGNTASRWGFRGTEDLGGGLGAGFWLEGAINADSGTTGTSNLNNTSAGVTDAVFGRRSTVSLMSQWGELRLGRDFNPTYRNRTDLDPFDNNGVGNSQANSGTLAGPTATRVSNSIAYFLPTGLAGFFGEAQYFMGENIQRSDLPDPHDGDGYGVRVGWASGPFAIAASGGQTQYTRTATTGDIQVWNVGASYSFDFMKITAGYYRDEVKSDTNVTGDGYIVGAIFPFGASQIKASYSSYGPDVPDDARADKLAVGYVYNFSKRTLVYTTYAYVRNDSNSSVALNGSLTAPGRHSQGFDLGIKHSF